MKRPSVKCARRQLQWRSCLILVPAALLFSVLSAQAQESVIPPVGGPGGGEFVARCPPGQLLGGVELRAGDDVDAIRPLCRTPTVNVEKVRLNPRINENGQLDYDQYEYRTTYGVKGDATANTDWYGGSGGAVKFLVCPSANPIVSGIYVEAEGVDTVIVNRIAMLCTSVQGGAPTVLHENEPGFWKSLRSDNNTVNFEAPKYNASHTGGFESRASEISGISFCPYRRENISTTSTFLIPTLAVAIHGRSGKWLDALGLICDEPKLPPTPVQAVGRVKGGGPTGPPRAICDVAREARARNSPAAPGLETQCRAAGPAGETPPVKAVGRVKAGTPTDTAPRSICDVAREARARNSPAAPGLEEKCRAAGEAPGADLNALAAKGEAIANADPLSAELRKRQPDDSSRRGFDIGMAAAEGQTAPGPGKQRIRGSLSPEEQKGFDIAVAFSIERNGNADLAAKGAAIAKVDEIVAEARTADGDVFYWLGFDIATAIFGDPALGALGNTAMGPGSQKIRDSLNPAMQRGFNAAVKFHLSRNYKP